MKICLRLPLIPFPHPWQANERVRRVSGTSQVITTVAGNGSTGGSGDGGPATSAELNDPAAVAIDGKGQLLIADCANHRIRIVDLTTGIISTVAGNGTNGFAGDGAQATTAMLSYPSGVAVDRDGVLIYIADANNQRIRTVDGSGVIITIAGNGNEGYLGDGGPASLATFQFPNGLAVASADGALFIADRANSAVRRIDAGADRVISTVAGNGRPGFSGDGGPATAAEVSDIFAVAVDATGNLFIAGARASTTCNRGH